MNKIIAYLLLFALAASPSFADTIKLKNGDRISGTVDSTQKMDAARTKIAVVTAYGTVEIPRLDIEEIIDDKMAEKENAAIKTAVADADKKAAEEAKPVARTWEDDYKDFIHAYMPSGWEFKLKGGMEYKDSTSRNITYSIGFDGLKKWDDFNEFSFKTWYEYATEKPQGLPETTSTDKYGIMTTYQRFFSKDKTWFLENLLGYNADHVKLIRHQVDEGVLFGRRFVFWNDEMTLNFAAGPAARYTSADGYSQHWAFMGTFTEDYVWKFHKYSRIEQGAYYGLNLFNWNKYSFLFNIGLVFDVTEIASVSCRYYYSYDNMTGSNAQKSEQRFLLGFEIPFK